jgi:hypothetical protein
MTIRASLYEGPLNKGGSICGHRVLPANCEDALVTQRRVIAQVSICVGCCCGNVDNGRPAVPVDWLKKEWRSRGLLKNVQLTISGCLGPCDLPNIVKVSTPAEDIWLGNITEFSQYRDLVEWASWSKQAGQLLALSPLYRQHRFDPFRT